MIKEEKRRDSIIGKMVASEDFASIGEAIATNTAIRMNQLNKMTLKIHEILEAISKEFMEWRIAYNDEVTKKERLWLRQQVRLSYEGSEKALPRVQAHWYADQHWFDKYDKNGKLVKKADPKYIAKATKLSAKKIATLEMYRDNPEKLRDLPENKRKRIIKEIADYEDSQELDYTRSETELRPYIKNVREVAKQRVKEFEHVRRAYLRLLKLIVEDRRSLINHWKMTDLHYACAENQMGNISEEKRIENSVMIESFFRDEVTIDPFGLKNELKYLPKREYQSADSTINKRTLKAQQLTKLYNSNVEGDGSSAGTVGKISNDDGFKFDENGDIEF